MIKAVIFAFEGVIITTNQFHFLAWEKIAEKENIDFNEQMFENIKDMPRMDALDILLANAHKKYKEMEKIRLSNLKNTYYLELIQSLTSESLLPGVTEMIQFLSSKKIPIAISSTSRNCKSIMTLLNMNNLFQAIVDGNDITRSKPDPEVFEKAARKLGISPKDCLVVEDSVKGIEAAHIAEMKSFAIGEATKSMLATYYGNDLIDLKNIII